MLLTQIPVFTILQETDASLLVDSFHAAAINNQGDSAWSRYFLDPESPHDEFVYAHKSGQLANVSPQGDELVGPRGGTPEIQYLNIIDDGRIFGRGELNSESVVGTWTSPGNFASVSLAPGQTDFSLHTLQSGATVNNSGTVVAFGERTLPDGPDEDLLVTSDGGVSVLGPEIEFFFMIHVLGIGDNGQALVGVLSRSESRYEELRLYESGLSSFRVVASRSRQFEMIDNANLSDDGRVVALVGELKSGVQSEALGAATGNKAIFAAVTTESQLVLRRVIGEAGDQTLDPHETWVGGNDVSAGVFRNYHDELGVSLIVQSDLDDQGLGTFTLAYKTQPAPPDISSPDSLFYGHLYRTSVLVDGKDGTKFFVSVPDSVVRSPLGAERGTAIDYQSKTAEGVRLWDMNEKGEILAEVRQENAEGKEFEALVRIEMVNRPLLLIAGIGGVFLRDNDDYDGENGWISIGDSLPIDWRMILLQTLTKRSQIRSPRTRLATPKASTSSRRLMTGVCWRGRLLREQTTTMVS